LLLVFITPVNKDYQLN